MLDETEAESPLIVPADYLKTYETVLFISHHDHYEKMKEEAQTGSRLIVVSDWLLLHDLLECGEHAIHLDACLSEDVASDAARRDLQEQANEWMYDADGHDLTEFRGVSLGRLFTRETSLAFMSIFQISKGSKWACETYQPKAVILYDIRTEFGLIPRDIKVELVGDAANSIAGQFINRIDDPGQDSMAFPYLQDFTHRPIAPPEFGTVSWAREVLRSVYANCIVWAFQLKWILNRRKSRVLLLPTGLMLQNLLAYINPSHNISPLLIAEREKKNVQFLLHLWAKGGSLCTLPKTQLSHYDHAQVERLIDVVKNNWMTRPASKLQSLLREYVETNILSDFELLSHSARSVCSIDQMLEMAKPSRIVVSDHMNPGTQEYIDLAFRKGIPVDYLPHGARISAIRHEALTGSRRLPAKITRTLIWGKQMAHYADDYGIVDRTLRIGYPGLDHLDAESQKASKIVPQKKENALILPYSSETEGYVNRSSLIFSNLLETVRAVHRQGYKNIRVKIHPGQKFNARYYRKVLAKTDIEVDIVHQLGGLVPHLAWADIVIGPIVSSSIVETLAYGRPFYAMLLQPSVNRPEYLKHVPLFSSARELEQALSDGTPVNREEILQYLSSRSDIKNASLEFWNAMRSQ